MARAVPGSLSSDAQICRAAEGFVLTVHGDGVSPLAAFLPTDHRAPMVPPNRPEGVRFCSNSPALRALRRVGKSSRRPPPSDRGRQDPPCRRPQDAGVARLGRGAMLCRNPQATAWGRRVTPILRYAARMYDFTVFPVRNDRSAFSALVRPRGHGGRCGGLRSSHSPREVLGYPYPGVAHH